jgi:hypothetical protein
MAGRSSGPITGRSLRPDRSRGSSVCGQPGADLGSRADARADAPPRHSDGAVLLDMGGAALVDRLVGPPSIYSGRIPRGQAKADGPHADGIVISVAARYADLLQMLLRGSQSLEAVCVVDQDSVVIAPVLFSQTRHLSLDDGPLETATAGDFVITHGLTGRDAPIANVTSAATVCSEADRRVTASLSRRAAGHNVP